LELCLVVAVALAVAVAVPVPATQASDPGHWRATGASRIPLEYYQGVTSDPRGALFFDGVLIGLYRADAKLREGGRNASVIPPAVTAAEGYNHVGDIGWDAREGGRVLLPLECYYPGQPGAANSCGTGSIGVADPGTLRWGYYVKLDPTEIPKAMWAEVSPDGRLVWTSAGADLLAYRTSDVSRAHAAPAAAPIHALRRLLGAVPSTGITGAAFYGDRLLVAGQQDTLLRVWSIDLSTGHRRLEIERTIVGESEGLDVADVLGGTLNWIVTPFDAAGRPPTYPPPGNTLLHFLSRTPRGRMRVSAAPNRLIAGRRTRVRFTVTGQHGAVAGAAVRFRGQVKPSAATGIAEFTVTLPHPGRYRARATRADLRPATHAVRAVALAHCGRTRC
jgi:hypothetical protein